MATEEEKRIIQEAAREDPAFARKFNIQVANNIGKAVGALGGTGIIALQIDNGTGDWLDLWRNGAPITPEPTIPDGHAWRLRVIVAVTSTVALWAHSITIHCDPVPTSGDYSGQAFFSQNQRYSFSGSNDGFTNQNGTKDFSMGAMPAGNVSLTVKCWVTDYWTVDPPPNAIPTLWS